MGHCGGPVEVGAVALGVAAYLRARRYVVRVKLSLTPPRELALALARMGEPWRLGVERHEHPACGGGRRFTSTWAAVGAWLSAGGR